MPAQESAQCFSKTRKQISPLLWGRPPQGEPDQNQRGERCDHWGEGYQHLGIAHVRSFSSWPLRSCQHGGVTDLITSHISGSSGSGFSDGRLYLQRSGSLRNCSDPILQGFQTEGGQVADRQDQFRYPATADPGDAADPREVLRAELDALYEAAGCPLPTPPGGPAQAYSHRSTCPPRN